MRILPALIIICLILFPIFVDNDITVITSAYASGESGKADFVSLENNVFKSFYDGDLYRLYDCIENLVLSYPDKPESIFYYYDLTRMPDIYGYERVRQTINAVIKSVEESDNLPEKNIYLLTLKLELEKLLYNHNRQEAEDFSKQFCPLRRWVIAGPYNKYGISDLDYPFMPEIASAFESSAEKKSLLISEPDGTLDPGRYLYPARGISYAFTTIKASGPVKIRIYSGCSYRLFINGRETIKNVKSGTFRKCRVLRVWNSDEITIMIKSYMDDKSGFRVLLTDDNDTILDAKPYIKKPALAGFEYQEELDYPFEYFLGEVDDNPEEAYFRLALNFDELGSQEALKYYRKSLEIKDDPVRKYLYAYSMIDQSEGEAESSLYLEGWKIIDSLAEKHSGFLPAQYMKFKSLLKSRSFLQAYYTGMEISTVGGRYLPLRADFADLLRYLGYEKEFLDETESLSAAFPFSAEPQRLLALYYKEKNISESITHYNKGLDIEYNDDNLSQLIGIYRSQGAYSDIISAIKKYGREDKFTKEMAEAYIDSGNYREAKDLIFKEMVKSADPYFNLKLGLISYIEESDPVMYWEKFMQISPSSFSTGDFFRYYKTGRIEDPFRGYRDKDISGEIIPWVLAGGSEVSSEILYRSYIFLLNRDGGSRVFCEDVIYLNDEKAIDRWGEYKVPFSGKIQPVRVRVYYEDGSYNDSYKVHSLNEESYITLSSLKEKSIVHVSYCLDNPVNEPRNSMFFSIPFIEIQNFNEGLGKFSLKVIAPADRHVNFFFNRDVEVSSESSGNSVIYSASLKNLGKVRREDFTGSPLNSLPFFTFSTMKDLDDIVRWYGGLIDASSEVDIRNIENRLKGGNAAAVVRNVYGYIADEIDLTGNPVFLPDRAADTLFARRGSAEDRAVLAMSILSELGIKSYAAFCRRDDLPDAGTFVSPSRFSDILLYVPLEAGTGIWLDFSSRYYPCGTVSEGLAGTEAVVIIGNGYEFKKIIDSGISGVTSNFKINLNEEGNAAFDIQVECRGTAGQLRGDFSNKNYNEDMINYYFGGIISSISIDDYQIANLEDRENPFKLRAKGNCFSIASAGMESLILQPVLKESGIYSYIRYPQREFPLLIGRAIDESDEYIYRLPLKYDSFTLDKSYKLMNKFGIAEINIKKEKGSEVLSVIRKIRVGKTRVSPDEYQEFLNFCLKLKNIERENIVIK